MHGHRNVKYQNSLPVENKLLFGQTWNRSCVYATNIEVKSERLWQNVYDVNLCFLITILISVLR
jgi:fumarate reductase subunit C